MMLVTLFPYPVLFVMLTKILVECKPAVVTNPPFIKTTDPNSKKMVCIRQSKSVTGKHKTCFLRPDTGPCRGDIVQFYYDVTLAKCHMFFWGGCQGNGNRFNTKDECMNYCFLNSTIIQMANTKTPHFCNLAFNFGNCYGHYYRWGYDRMSKTCKRHLYSGCGGNQNNFQTKQECAATCVQAPRHEDIANTGVTTCVPFNAVEIIS